MVYTATFHRLERASTGRGFGIELQLAVGSFGSLAVAQTLSSSPFAVSVPMGGAIQEGDVLIAVQGLPVFEPGAFDTTDVVEMLRLAALRGTATCTFARPRLNKRIATDVHTVEAEWREELGIASAPGDELFAGVINESALHACLLFLQIGRSALRRDDAEEMWAPAAPSSATARLVRRIVLHRVLSSRRRGSTTAAGGRPALFVWLRRLLCAQELSHVQSVALVVVQLLRERRREVLSAACIDLPPADRAVYVAALPPIDARALSAVLALLDGERAPPKRRVWRALTQQDKRGCEAGAGVSIEWFDALREFVGGRGPGFVAPREWQLARALTSCLRSAAAHDAALRGELFGAHRVQLDSALLERARARTVDAVGAAEAVAEGDGRARQERVFDAIAGALASEAAEGGAGGAGERASSVWHVAGALLLDALRVNALATPLVPSWAQAGLLLLCSPAVLPDRVSRRAAARTVLRPVCAARPLLAELLALLSLIAVDADHVQRLAFRFGPLIGGETAALDDDGERVSAPAAARRAKLAIAATAFVIVNADAVAPLVAEAPREALRGLSAARSARRRSFAELHAAFAPSALRARTERTT